MNILKNMEAVFIVTLALSASALYLDSAIPSAQAHAAPLAQGQQMTVVSVVGKRMTAQEKIISLQNEQRQASLHGNAASEI